MNDAQREAWRKAIAASRRQQRTRRGKRTAGITTVTGPGMLRVPPPQDHPAPGGAAQKGTT
jgi:hypothetical protein